jgi:hypothetical protein
MSGIGNKLPAIGAAYDEFNRLRDIYNREHDINSKNNRWKKNNENFKKLRRSQVILSNLIHDLSPEEKQSIIEQTGDPRYFDDIYGYMETLSQYGGKRTKTRSKYTTRSKKHHGKSRKHRKHRK